MKRIKWIFNPLMIWGAVLGFWIITCLGEIQEAYYHRGPGYIFSEIYGTEKVSEKSYKRQKLTMGVFSLGLGVLFWVLVAPHAKEAKANKEKSRINPMFWKQRPRQGDTNVNNLDAAKIVSKVGEVYADFNEKEQLVKPSSSLPCPWSVVRECFMKAYETEYLELTENLRDSYHFMYGELSFFVDDNLCKDFNSSLNIAAKCRFEQSQKLGLSKDETFYRKFIASDAVKVQNREEIWADLAREETCPRQHLILLAETLTYCSALHRSMWDEWAAFANLIAYRKKKQ